MNNGFSTHPIDIRRGVRQGDPLSPYLFIICLETLAISVRRNKNIQGILVDKEEIKLEMFADDVTAFLRNTRSLEALLHTADLFSKCSGLEINSEKTECMVLGNHVSSTVATVISSKNIRMKDTIKILGVYFTYNDSQRKKLNFDEILRSIKEKLQMWKWRDLTILGRIQIVKTFVIPLFMYRASLICVQKDTVIEVNKLLFKFIWKGKDKVKRLSLICDLDKGGLKAPHLESTRTTTWNLPGPSGTRDCINAPLTPHPSSVEANIDVIHNQRQKTVKVASVLLFRHILNTKSWLECCFSPLKSRM